MKHYAYYPGCSAEATAIGMGLSIQAIAKPLDIELLEIEDWTCCGSTPYGSLNELEAIPVVARNLALAEKTGDNRKVAEIKTSTRVVLAFPRITFH